MFIIPIIINHAETVKDPLCSHNGNPTPTDFLQKRLLVILPSLDQLQLFIYKRANTQAKRPRTSFCREIIPSRKACNESLKSSIRSCSNRATSDFTNFETCSYSSFDSDALRSAFIDTNMHQQKLHDTLEPRHLCNLA